MTVGYITVTPPDINNQLYYIYQTILKGGKQAISRVKGDLGE